MTNSDTITLDSIVGYQQRPENSDNFLMYYMEYMEQPPDVGLRVLRFAVDGSTGYTSIEELLNDIPINEELKVRRTNKWVFPLYVGRAANRIAAMSCRGPGKLVSGNSTGKFVAHAGVTNWDRPIFSYDDKSGTRRYVASPILDKLLVRIS